MPVAYATAAHSPSAHHSTPQRQRNPHQAVAAMQNENALAHKIASIRHLLHAASEVQSGCPPIATDLRTRATDLLTEVQAEVQAEVQSDATDATDQAAHWTRDLTERQINAVLDAVNAGQSFDHVLKRLHTS